MASKTSAPDEPVWPGRRVSHADFAARLAERRTATGITDLPRNSCKRRTASKQALLKAIEEAGGEW